MTSVGDSPNPGDWAKGLRGAVETACADAASLEDAAQGTVKGAYERFPEAMVLVRLFATLPFGGLPEPIQATPKAKAASAGLTLKPDTPVLTLLGSYGLEEDWRDRRRSKAHAGIPLISSEFIANIPMLARVLEELGADLKGFDIADRQPFVEAGLFKSGAFLVPDAATAVDLRGRKVIAGQEFVQKHGVTTVFGAGVSFLGTTTHATLICFTRRELDLEVSQAALTALSQFRAMTQRLVNEGKLLA